MKQEQQGTKQWSGRRACRCFDETLKREAVGLGRAGDRSIKRVAHELDSTETALRARVQHADVDELLKPRSEETLDAGPSTLPEGGKLD